MDRLPIEISVLIFVRLPAKTIGQCLSVCKLWKRVILNPSFIQSHLQHQHQSHNHMLVRHTDVVSEWYAVHKDDESFSLCANYKFPGPNSELLYGVVGSCNGILCITDETSYSTNLTYLWNPAIRKLVELPRPMFTAEITDEGDRRLKFELGFGLDKKTNDYKVVRIAQLVTGGSLQVEIYSLQTGIWTDASHLALNLGGVELFSRQNCLRRVQVYLNGAVHWVCWDWKTSRPVIIVFDLGYEVFRYFDTPMDWAKKILVTPEDMGERCLDYGDIEWVKNLCLTVFQGSLCLIQIGMVQYKCIIYIMNDYGVSSSWTKYLDFEIASWPYSVLGLRSAGQVIIEYLGCLYSLDLKVMNGKQYNCLSDFELKLWKQIQEGHLEKVLKRCGGVIPDNILNYDPEAQPHDLGYKDAGIIQDALHVISYIESLEMLLKMNPTASEVKIEGKELESERTCNMPCVSPLVPELITGELAFTDGTYDFDASYRRNVKVDGGVECPDLCNFEKKVTKVGASSAKWRKDGKCNMLKISSTKDVYSLSKKKEKAIVPFSEETPSDRVPKVMSDTEEMTCIGDGKVVEKVIVKGLAITDFEKVDMPAETTQKVTSGTPHGVDYQPVTERVFKYTFQRKRKKEPLNSSDRGAPADEEVVMKKKYRKDIKLSLGVGGEL